MAYGFSQFILYGAIAVLFYAGAKFNYSYSLNHSKKI